MRACQRGKWAVLAGWHGMYWWHDPWQSVRGNGWENEGPARTSIFPSPLRHCETPTIFAFISSLSSSNISQVYSCMGPVFFHSAQIFFFTSFSLLGFFSIYWFFPSSWQLWTPSPPTLSSICFFRNGIQLEMWRALTWLFSFIGWDHTCWTEGFIIQRSIP